MTNRRLFLLALLLVGGPALMLPGIHWHLIGWSKGEEFYDGRPTSWWVTEIQESFQEFTFSIDRHGRDAVPFWTRSRSSTLLERARSAWDGGPRCETDWGPPLANGDARALPVLLRLLGNEDPKVRNVAVCGLCPLAVNGNTALVPLIEGALHDGDEKVRGAARRALAWIATGSE